MLDLLFIFCLEWFDVGPLVGVIVAAVVVPGSMSAIIVIFKNHAVNASVVVLGLRDISNPMVLLGNGLFHSQVLLSLDVLLLEVEVQLIVLSVL